MKIMVSGTFDTVHAGHEALLNKAIELAELYLCDLVINVTSDSFAAAKKHEVNPYNQRVDGVVAHLMSRGYMGEFRIRKLDAISGDGDTLSEFEDGPVTLVASIETYPGVLELNGLLQDLNLQPVVTVIIPMQLAKDGFKISSTRIRRGDIDESGNTK